MATNGSIFYVGKGHGRRAKEKSSRSLWWKNIVEKHGYYIEFIAEHLTEPEAFEFEAFAISLIPGLCNLTLGGEGSCGYSHSEEARKKMSLSRKGRKVSQEVREKISRGHKGRTVSEVGRSNISRAGKKYFASEAGKANIENQRFRRGNHIRCVETGQIFYSHRSAAEHMRSCGHPTADKSSFWRCFKNGRNKLYGLTWEEC